MSTVKYKKAKAHEEGIWCCAWGRNEETSEEFIMSGSLDNALKIWKWQSNQLELVKVLEGHRLGVISVDINQGGTLAASSSLDCQIYIWDLESGSSLSVYDGSPVDTWTVAFSPDSRFICTGSYAGCINMIGVESAKKENVFELEGKFIYSLAYSPDGTKIAAGAMNGLVSIVDLETGDVQSLDGHAKTVRGLTFSGDGNLLASCADDFQIKVYDVRDRRVVAPQLNGHSGAVTSVSFIPDGTCRNGFSLASGSMDKTIRIWDLRKRSEKHVFSEHEDQVWCVKTSPDGSKALSAGDDKALIIHDIPQSAA